MDNRHWKIAAIAVLPKLVVAVEAPDPGSLLPKKIGFQSRVTGKTCGQVQGLGNVVIEPNPDSLLQPPAPNLDLVMISFETRAGTPETALSETAASFELLMDDLSFQMQVAVRALMLEVLDVTPPVEVGAERENLLYPYPIGWPYPKFQESQFHGDSITSVVPLLRSVEELKHKRTRAALRWYVKALATPFDVDRFAFLWIALEILCSESSTTVEKPYRASCGHEIGSCPECGKSTSREVQGPTLISFLAEELGVQTVDAKELWRTRQLFHGSNDLTTESIQPLPRLLLILKSAVARGLKITARQPALTLPHVLAGVVGISKSFAIGGRRKVVASDLS